MEDIVNDILENPKPYKYALEAGAGATLGAAYRTSKIYREKLQGIKADPIPYDEEFTSAGLGFLAYTADGLRESVGKSQIFDHDDLAFITGSVYTGQKIADRKFSDDSEDYKLD